MLVSWDHYPDQDVLIGRPKVPIERKFYTVLRFEITRSKNGKMWVLTYVTNSKVYRWKEKAELIDTLRKKVEVYVESCYRDTDFTG